MNIICRLFGHKMTGYSNVPTAENDVSTEERHCVRGDLVEIRHWIENYKTKMYETWMESQKSPAPGWRPIL